MLFIMTEAKRNSALGDETEELVATVKMMALGDLTLPENSGKDIIEVSEVILDRMIQDAKGQNDQKATAMFENARARLSIID
jgi:hypothetical protein